MKPDCELLRQYAVHGDDAAFTEVVRRHVNLVHASALRLLNGNAAMAQDVTQIVFTDLARKAGGLTQHTSVAGWLHTSVRFAAANAVRSEQRRRLREQEASAMSDQTNVHETAWMQMRPLIDEAVGQLHEPERDAVLLRFFEEKSHREVGVALGLTENAARMRVERGLEKLRTHLARHGIIASVVLLAATLSAHAASTPAPAVLTAAVAGKALLNTGLSTSRTGPAKAGLRIFWSTKAPVALAGSVAMLSAAAFIFTQANTPASPSAKHPSVSSAPAPIIVPADILAEMQAKMAKAPDMLTTASTAATALATTGATTSAQLLQSLPQEARPQVVNNSDVEPADETADASGAAPMADNTAPASGPDPNVSPPTASAVPAVVAAIPPAQAVSPFSNGKMAQWSLRLGGNGHYYLAVVEPHGITWAGAQAYAAQRGGHLATIATKEENDFVFNLVNAPEFWQLSANKRALLGPWLGAVHSADATDMTYGWQWINRGGTLTFANWAVQEPNAGGNRLHFFAWGSNPQPTWNNDPAQVLMPAFVVEFDTKPEPALSASTSRALPPAVAQNRDANVPRGTSPSSGGYQRQVVVRPVGSAPVPGRLPLPSQRPNGPMTPNKFQPLAFSVPGAPATQ